MADKTLVFGAPSTFGATAQPAAPLAFGASAPAAAPLTFGATAPAAAPLAFGASAPAAAPLAFGASAPAAAPLTFGATAPAAAPLAFGATAPAAAQPAAANIFGGATQPTAAVPAPPQPAATNTFGAAGAAFGASPPPALAGNEQASEVYKKETIKNIIEKWKRDLHDNVKKFNIQAKNAKRWEDQLYSNQKTMKKVTDDLFVVNQNQEELRDILDKVEEYQQTLDKTLSEIEKGLETSTHQQEIARRSENADKRGHAYELVDKLQHRLETMEASLTALAKDFNASRGGSHDSAIIGGSRESSVAQTVEILNHQFELLATLDERNRGLQSSMFDVNSILRHAQK